MQKSNDTLSGFVRTIILLGHGKDKQPFNEKSKSKHKKKDYSDARRKKRDYD